MRPGCGCTHTAVRTAMSRQEHSGPQESHHACGAKDFIHWSSSDQRSFIHDLSRMCIKAMGRSISLFLGSRTTNEMVHCSGKEPSNSALRMMSASVWHWPSVRARARCGVQPSGPGALSGTLRRYRLTCSHVSGCSSRAWAQARVRRSSKSWGGLVPELCQSWDHCCSLSSNLLAAEKVGKASQQRPRACGCI